MSDLRRTYPTLGVYALLAGVLIAQGFAHACTADAVTPLVSAHAVVEVLPLAKVLASDESVSDAALGRLAAAQLAALPENADPNLNFSFASARWSL